MNKKLKMKGFAIFAWIGMSPIFTSGKIKGMLQYVNCTLDNMMEHLEKGHI